MKSFLHLYSLPLHLHKITDNWIQIFFFFLLVCDGKHIFFIALTQIRAQINTRYEIKHSIMIIRDNKTGRGERPL